MMKYMDNTCFAGNTPVGEFVEYKGRKMLVVDDNTFKEALSALKKNWIDGICTSFITDMSELLLSEEFNQDISDWDVSNVTDMSYMFAHAVAFNQDISDWDVSNVTDMHSMFCGATEFNQDISNWDVSSVTNMTSMFNQDVAFNQDISKWDVSNVINMNCMFRMATSFNQDLSKWNLSSVKNKEGMFFETAMETNYDDDDE